MLLIMKLIGLMWRSIQGRLLQSLYTCLVPRHCIDSLTQLVFYWALKYRSVPLIRPLQKYAPHSLPPKFLHKVVWLVITPPGEHLLEVCGYKSSRCQSCAGSTSRLWKFPVVHDRQYCCSWGQLQRSHRECYWPRIELAALLFSDVGRPQSFVNLMFTNSTLDPVSTLLCRMLL